MHLFGYGSYRTDYAQITLLKRVMEFLGGDNMFKRYVFGDGKWLMVQGYSLTIFEEPLKPAQLAKMVSSRALSVPSTSDELRIGDQEHTWYEGYRLSYPDRPPVPERHDWDGLKVKQTFYIVRSRVTKLSTWQSADFHVPPGRHRSSSRHSLLVDGPTDPSFPLRRKSSRHRQQC